MARTNDISGGGGGTVTSVTASLPLTSSGGTTPNIAIAAGYSFLIGSTSGLLSDPTPGVTFETWFGNLAGSAGGSKSSTTFIGLNAGQGATGADASVFIGPSTGFNATGAQHSQFIGSAAGQGATSASFATFLGDGAGDAATKAAGSIFIGFNAGSHDTVDNTASGTSILIGSTTSTGGYQNSIALGEGATNTAANQFLVGSSGTPVDNITFVSPAGTIVYIDNASSNTFIGNGAGSSVVASTLIGGNAGQSTTGTGAYILGQNAGYQAGNVSGALLMGYQAGENAGNPYGSIMLGQNAGYGSGGAGGSNESIFLGHNAANTVNTPADVNLNNTTANFSSILLGSNTSTGGFSNSIGIGFGATNTASNQLVIGSPTTPILDVVLGQGDAGTSPQYVTIRNSNGVGANAEGSGIVIQNGISTGNVPTPDFLIQVAPPGSAGSTLNTPQTVFEINGTTLAISFNGLYAFPVTAPGVGQVLGYSAPNVLDWVTGGGGGTIGGTIAAHQVGWGSALNTLDSSGNFTFVDGTNPVMKVGDIAGAGNSTKFTVDDNLTDITAVSSGNFTVQNTSSNPFFNVALNANKVQIGDFGGSFNGTSLVVDDTNKLLPVTVGIFRGNAFHNNAAGQGSATEQDIRSGEYTPTIHTSINTGVLTAFQTAQWLRVGNVVTVTGHGIVQQSGGAAFSVTLTLPVPSAFAQDYQCAGAINADDVSTTTYVAAVTGATGYVIFDMGNAGGAGTYLLSYSYSYLVL